MPPVAGVVTLDVSCRGRLSCDLAALRLPELWVSLAIGAAALAVGLGTIRALHRAHGPSVGSRTGRPVAEPQRKGLVAPRRSPAASRPIGVAGLLLLVGILVALAALGQLVPGLVVAVVLLVLGAGAAASGSAAHLPGPLSGAPPLRARHASTPAASTVRRAVGGLGAPARQAVAALPGAAVLALATRLPAPLVARLLAGAVVVLVAATLPGFERRHRRAALGPVLFAVSAVGCYETVPTPELALVVVGVSVPLALLGWPRPLARLGRAGPATLAILAWAAVEGGQGRPVTMVTGLACLGLFLVEPLAAALARRTDPPRRLLGEPRAGGRDTLVVALGQLVLVATLSQAYPLTGGGGLDVVVTLGLLALATGILLAGARSPRRATPARARRGHPLG